MSNESLTFEDGRKATISKVCFTFAMDGGMWLQDSFGQKDWLSFATIASRYGRDAMEKWYHIAFANGWCGMWYDVENGKLSAIRDGVLASY